MRGLRPPRRHRGCGRPPAARSPGRHLGSLPRLQERAAGHCGRWLPGQPAGPHSPADGRAAARAGLATGRGCRGTGRPKDSARSLTPLCDSGSATAPPETSRPRPIRARLLTSMRLALARAVALATLKGQTPGFLLPPPLARRLLARIVHLQRRYPSYLVACAQPLPRSHLFLLFPQA